MTHKTLTRVNFNGKMFEPGKPIRFGAEDAEVRNELLECGAIAEASPQKTADPDDIHQMNVPKLKDVAAQEGVDLAKTANRADILKAIEDKRAEVKAAPAADDAGQPGDSAT